MSELSIDPPPGSSSDGSMHLDWNENALGTPASAARAVVEMATELHRYPRGLHDTVLAAVAADAGVPASSVVLTAGVDDALDRVLLRAGSALCFTPGFLGYPERATALGIPLTVLPLGADDWAPPPLGPWVDTVGVVILTQPHLPTGNLFEPSWMEAVLDRARLVFIDETYLDFSDRPSYVPRILAGGNICVFRSFSKTLGLAGLRFGALFGPPTLIEDLRSQVRFFPVDSIALRAVGAAIEDRSFRAAYIEHVRSWRPRWVDALAGFRERFVDVSTTEANYVLARCRSEGDAARIVAGLDAAGVRVGNCLPFGLPSWIRVGVGTGAQLAALCDALAALDQGSPTTAAPVGGSGS